MRVAAVQARMGSTRLPGKVVADICGTPMLLQIVRRLERARTINEVIIATADTPENDPIRAVASTNGARCFSGSETDIVGRLKGAAEVTGADCLVRITADCPLVDPWVVDELVELFLNGDYDYCTNNVPPTFPHGLDAEVYSAETLSRLDAEIGTPTAREWITVYLREQGDRFAHANLRHSPDLSMLRWTVDYPEDLEFVRAVYERLGGESPTFAMKDVLELLAREPDLAGLNAHHRRNEGFDEVLKTIRLEAATEPADKRERR